MFNSFRLSALNSLEGSSNEAVFGIDAALADSPNLLQLYGNTAPVAGTYRRGEKVKNIRSVVGQPVGWECTVAGTPGTWVALANL